MDTLLYVWLVWWIVALCPPIYVKIPFTIGRWFGGITIAPFVFLNERYYNDPAARCHEYRHIQQMRWMSPLVFLFVYFVNWFVLFIEYLHDESFWQAWYKAYYNVWFEKDARRHEQCKDTTF